MAQKYMPPSNIIELQKELKLALKVQPPYHRDVDVLANKLRDLITSRVFENLLVAHEEDLDNVLWIRVHYPIIEAYRKILAKAQAQIKSKPVEARKLHDSFVKFIKCSSGFYRKYIADLGEIFVVKEVNSVVSRFHFDFKRSSRRRSVSRPASSTTKDLVLRSCNRALVCLGDLSRYLESQEISDKKDWRPAMNYYNLAKQLLPRFAGFSHNQMAVISIKEGSVLGATFHFYRALCAAELFPTAKDNLQLGFKKFLKKQEIDGRKDEIMVAELLVLYLKFHATVFADEDISDALETEILQHLRTGLNYRKLSADILTKMVLINISALWLARQEGKAKFENAMLFFNIVFATTLLKILDDELNQTYSQSRGKLQDTSDISPVARRVLYGLRIYSTWLLDNVNILGSEQQDHECSIKISDLWLQYASTMSLVSTYFGDVTLESDVLLKDDIDLLDYVPLRLRSKETLSLTQQDERISHLHPHEETLLRIASLLTDAIALSERIEVPLLYEDSKFTYSPSKISSTPADMVSSLPPIGSDRRLDTVTLQVPRTPIGTDFAQVHHGNGSIVGSVTSEERGLSYMMHAMVDSLVEETPLPKQPDEILFTGRRKLETPKLPNQAKQATWAGSFNTTPSGFSAFGMPHGLLGGQNTYEAVFSSSRNGPQSGAQPLQLATNMSSAPDNANVAAPFFPPPQVKSANLQQSYAGDKWFGSQKVQARESLSGYKNF
ncbi:hypothetical protein V1514DRAFT_325590 [Lipomyces japonicus]|uniref:uncharacterized protein n=1 Tax=Lipomyces japonicus TaxID=56871 RepID=UPI0034CE6069